MVRERKVRLENGEERFENEIHAYNSNLDDDFCTFLHFEKIFDDIYQQAMHILQLQAAGLSFLSSFLIFAAGPLCTIYINLSLLVDQYGQQLSYGLFCLIWLIILLTFISILGQIWLHLLTSDLSILPEPNNLQNDNNQSQRLFKICRLSWFLFFVHLLEYLSIYVFYMLIPKMLMSFHETNNSECYLHLLSQTVNFSLLSAYTVQLLLGPCWLFGLMPVLPGDLAIYPVTNVLLDSDCVELQFLRQLIPQLMANQQRDDVEFLISYRLVPLVQRIETRYSTALNSPRFVQLIHKLNSF